MIASHEVERAEQVLKVIYGGDLERQLEHLQVDREVIANMVSHCWEIIDRHYKGSRSAMDPRLTAPINTMLVHFFLVGVVAGKNAEREIL